MTRTLALVAVLILAASGSAQEPAPIPRGTGVEQGVGQTTPVAPGRSPAPPGSFLFPDSDRDAARAVGDASDRKPLRGTATWFRSPIGVSAAGPDLRRALGPDWRGTWIRVCGRAGCATTQLGDWMRADRLVDLDAPVFWAVCGELWRGVCRVRVAVTGGIGLPETDTP